MTMSISHEETEFGKRMAENITRGVLTPEEARTFEKLFLKVVYASPEFKEELKPGQIHGVVDNE